jgi:hypothetical protein
MEQLIQVAVQEQQQVGLVLVMQLVVVAVQES